MLLRSVLARLLATLAPVLLLASAGPATAAFECNSGLVLELPPGSVPSGARVPVTLTVSNGLSRDLFNESVAQTFDEISFFPSCTSIPCVADPSLPVAFLGTASTDCPVDFHWQATSSSGGNQIDFTFTGGTGSNSDALTLPAAVPATSTTSCQLVFYVAIDPSFTGTVSMEATTTGLCAVTGLSSSAQADASLTAVALGSEVVVDGVIESTGGGLRFPDGSLQTTAYPGDNVSTASAAAATAAAARGSHSETLVARNPDPPCFDAARRFVDCGNGTVTDTATGLIHLKNTDCFAEQTWPDANHSASTLAAGQCGLADGSLPGDWRLQTIEEWRALLEPTCASGPMMAGEGAKGSCLADSAWALGVAPADYWSSTPDLDRPKDAWKASLGTGLAGRAGKATAARVWPVRKGW